MEKLDVVLESLHPLERRVLRYIKDNVTVKDNVTADEISFSAKMQKVEAMRALQWLESKKALILNQKLIEVVELDKNGEFCIKKGFPEIDFFPDIFAVWQKKQLKELKGILKEMPKLFSPALKNSRKAPRWGMLDRLNGRSKCNKVILGCDGEFYLCDKVLSLPLSQRKQYSVGNTWSGVDFKKRLSLLSKLNNEYLRITRSKCGKCIYKKFCFCPIGLYIYCNEMNKDFRKHFYSFCEISKMYIDAASKVASSYNRQITQN